MTDWPFGRLDEGHTTDGEVEVVCPCSTIKVCWVLDVPKMSDTCLLGFGGRVTRRRWMGSIFVLSRSRNSCRDVVRVLEHLVDELVGLVGNGELEQNLARYAMLSTVP